MFNSFLCRLFLGVLLITVAFSAIANNDVKTVVSQMRQQEFKAAKAGDIGVNYQIQTDTSGLGDLVNAMRAADAGKAQPGDIVLNWGNHVSGTSDVSPQPLFTHVNENLFKRRTYDALIQILNRNYFHPPTCENESTDPPKITYEHLFLLEVTNTTVFQLAYQYLKTKGVAGNDQNAFVNTLFNLWFGTYSRCSPHIGSSGWEHVYSGEWIEKKKEIDGQHNWIRYYLLEKAGSMNYHGYYSLTGTFQYTWSTYLKKTGGFLIGTSPEFDFSLFTVCVLSAKGDNACRFAIDGYPLNVTSYTERCSVGECLSTSYPLNH